MAEQMVTCPKCQARFLKLSPLVKCMAAHCFFFHLTSYFPYQALGSILLHNRMALKQLKQHNNSFGSQALPVGDIRWFFGPEYQHRDTSKVTLRIQPGSMRLLAILFCHNAIAQSGLVSLYAGSLFGE